MYRALPVEPDLSRIRAVVPVWASVLDLGAGPGRITNALAADGCRVVAVDDSVEMLNCVVEAETVLADVWDLDLGRRFDVVLALSHLINARSPSRRVGLLRVCRRHVGNDGVIVLQRYPPGWSPVEGSSYIGEVGVRLFDVRLFDDGGFAAAVTYSLGERSWTQRFEAAIVDDDELATLAADNDLIIRGTLDDAGTWILLGPARS